MNHRDCFRFGGDGILDLLLIDIHGVRTDIDEDRDAAAQDEAVRRRNEGIRRHDNFIARLDAGQMRCHLKRTGAGSREQYGRCVRLLLQPFAYFLCELTVAADLAVRLCCLLKAFHFGSRVRRNIKRDHDHYLILKAIVDFHFTTSVTFPTEDIPHNSRFHTCACSRPLQGRMQSLSPSLRSPVPGRSRGEEQPPEAPRF